MHRLSELEWQSIGTGSVAVIVPESPAEENVGEETDEPMTRRANTFGGPVELLGEAFPLVLCDARDPDEEEDEDDLDYLYDDEEDDLDEDLDEDLEELEDEEEELEDEDEDL